MGSPNSLCRHGRDPYGCPKCEAEEEGRDWPAISCLGGICIGMLVLFAGVVRLSLPTMLVGGSITILVLVAFGIAQTRR